MNQDKLRMYLLSALSFAALLPIFVLNLGGSRFTRALAALLLAVLALAISRTIRRRRPLSVRKKDVLLLHLAMGVLYVVILHMSGLYFGYYRNPYTLNADLLLWVLLPTTVIIVTTEIIRAVLLAQRNQFASLMAYATAVLAEALMQTNLAGVTSFNKFMDLVGMTLFPAIVANVYYHHACKSYGPWPNVLLRVITTLYVFFIPTTAAMSDAIAACCKIFFPIILLVLVSALYEVKKKKAIRPKGHRLSWVATALTVVLITGVAMIISCQFRYGALVVATGSMTGEINRGDMILYERYEDQPIEVGQVIVFLDGNNKIIHRVVDMEQKNGEWRYYTKGDANNSPDAGYRTTKDIFGVTDFKIPYIGLPSLWLRELVLN